MADPVDVVIPLPREMRAENAALHERTRELIKALDKRSGVVEGAQGSFRQALTADALLSKLVTGEFEGRIEALERTVRKLERQK